MDGNGRWAKRRMLPRFAGHQAGVRAVRDVVAACAEKGVEVLTLFAFSSENWRRPAKEVGLLMDLLLSALNREVGKLHENNVRMRVIGDRTAFAAEIQEGIARAEDLTRHNTGLTLVIAINYGGRWDIARAAQALAERVKAGELDPAAITPEALEGELALSDLPPVDLFIRSGGEQRISNFLIWQLVYSELYFTDTLWPDFGRGALDDAFASYAKRQRRFGCTGEQVEALQHA
ncbi:di-trans,poly-cis-decaprenylcistransferase [Ectothiorhodospiraceae bacterium 2226]|nr:di-trans,poly-cis-decaprenylcistransferase [Ectothiorhodospiraceae bacterium 2226]